MLLSFLPQEQGVSWEYHLSGAVFGLLSGLTMAGLDERAPKRLYSWDLETETADPAVDSELEAPIPPDIPVIWHRPERRHHNTVIPFKRNEP